MEISDRLLCLFSEQVTERNGSYVLEIPEQELRLGDIDEGESYRVAVLPAQADGTPTEESEPTDSSGREPVGPPVVEGENRVVEIENLGEQGDGIARVDRGYVVIVPDTELGERAQVEIGTVQENVAFAEVVERMSHDE